MSLASVATRTERFGDLGFGGSYHRVVLEKGARKGLVGGEGVFERKGKGKVGLEFE